MTKISFVLPFYNEEQTLPLLISRIRKVMTKEPEDFEMIFVNDASKDNSAKIIADQAKQKGKGKTVLVNMSRRFGVEESFMAGIGVAQGDAVILMYTDLQDPPEVVHKMLASWREGAEIVHPIRNKRIGEHPLKKLAAFIAYRIIGKISEIKIPYDAGEFKLISRNVAKHLLSLPEAEPYLRGLIPWIGFKQTLVEYDLQPRSLGQSKVPLFGKKSWTVFLSGIISFSDFPIYLILLIGIGGMLVSLVLGIFLLLYGGQDWLSVKEVLSIFSWATVIFALGFVGLYVLRIYKNTRGRPRYIIKNISHFED